MTIIARLFWCLPKNLHNLLPEQLGQRALNFAQDFPITKVSTMKGFLKIQPLNECLKGSFPSMGNPNRTCVRFKQMLRKDT